MILLELALYGIRNFTQLTRLAFKPHLNLIQGGNGSGKSSICDALHAILSPMEETPAELLSPIQSLDYCQAGLVFKTKDMRTWRIVRDFRGRKCSLAELDATHKFQITMQEDDAIVRFLSEEAGGLSRSTLEGLFSMKSEWMPSSHPIAAYRLEAVPPPPSSQKASSDHTQTLPHDQVKKRTRLEELKTLLSKGDQLAALEDQISDLQSRSAESKRRLRLATEKTDELARLSQEESVFEALKDVPEDCAQILETSEQQEQLKTVQMTSIAEEQEFLNQELQSMQGQPFFLNQYFIAGAVLTPVSIVLLSVLSLGGLFQNLLMMTMLAGVALMGYAGVMDFVKLNKRRGVELKIREADRKRSHIEAAFKKENAVCIALLKKTACADIQSLREKLKGYEQFVSARRLLEKERDQYLGPKTLEALQGDVASAASQIAEMEAKLRAASSLPSDIYLLQEEVRVLERELAEPSSVETLPSLDPIPNPAPVIGPPAGSPDGRAGEFLSPLFRDALQNPAVQAVLEGRRVELSREMTRMSEVLLGSIGAEMSLNDAMAPILLSNEKTPVSWAKYSSGQQDLFRLIHQLAVIMILSQSHPQPLLMDNPLPALDPAHQEKVLDILREIAQNRQVIFLSTVAHPNREGDHHIQLK